MTFFRGWNGFSNAQSESLADYLVIGLPQMPSYGELRKGTNAVLPAASFSAFRSKKKWRFSYKAIIDSSNEIYIYIEGDCLEEQKINYWTQFCSQVLRVDRIGFSIETHLMLYWKLIWILSRKSLVIILIKTTYLNTRDNKILILLTIKVFRPIRTAWISTLHFLMQCRIGL